MFNGLSYNGILTKNTITINNNKSISIGANKLKKIIKLQKFLAFHSKKNKLTKIKKIVIFNL